MMGWGYMGGGGLWMASVWLIGVVLVVLTVVAILRVLDPSRRAGSDPLGAAVGHQAPAVEVRSAAESELELRYARGEIDAETLVVQRAVLRQR